jgi:hypothetical protein
METSGLRLQLLMRASPPLVSVTRRFVEEAIEKYINDADLISRVAMAAHELLENAAKYAHQAAADLSLVLDRDGAGGAHLTLRLSNPTSPHHLDRLKRLFAELDSSADPLVLYVDLMRRNAHRREISGLGLARIRAEGEMALTLRVEGDTVTIVARAPVPPEELS